MENPFDIEQIEEIKEAMITEGPASAATKIQEYLEQQKNTPLNIGITGDSGSGKSTFVNAFRGVDDMDDAAAPTGCVETTMEVTAYPHPSYPNVTLWDLPGIGTTNFPADEYLKLVGFEKFDFFIIISATRFRENDVKLAKEIQRMGKKFYFVRSKIDSTLQDEERSKREFDALSTLAQIRENCFQGLQKQGVVSPQVFLVSSFDLHLYDFHQLEKTLERELPAHKKNVLLLAMPNISCEIISKKKDALHVEIKYHAFISALIASAPVTGLSFAVDLAILTSAILEYKVTFGLDRMSLLNLSCSVRVPLNDLRGVMRSPLALKEINTDLILKLLSLSAGEAALMAAEEGFRFIPLFGIPAAMTLSFISTYRALNTFLDMLAEDAQRVFIKALGFL